MSGSESKSSNPPDSDVTIFTPPMLVVVSEGVVPALVTKYVLNKSSVGFRSTADVEMVNPDKKVSNLQQYIENKSAISRLIFI